MERQPFYLTKRKLRSGKSVYYYYYYDMYGNRTVPKSTGYSKKVDAFNYCVNLLRTDNIGCNKTRFRVFAAGFFDDNSRWYKNKLISGGIAKNTLMSYRSAFKYHIYPYFSEMYIDKVTTNIIREFRVYLAEEKDLSNKSINNIVDITRIIFDWAVEDNLILKNPVSKQIKALETDHRREAFTLDEIKSIFSFKWDDYQSWLFCLTGAITGMRFSEVQGLQPCDIRNGFIDLREQYQDGRVELKTKTPRFIPIPKELESMLLNNAKGDYIFSSAGDCFKPVPRTTIVRQLYSHYTKDMLEQKYDRNLTFHSFRYFMNTYLLANNIISQKVNFIIGHSDGKGVMQKLYTTWQPDMYSDVKEVLFRLWDILWRETGCC